MKKQFLRVKQIADQTFLRAEKTEVLTDDLISAEKKVETIKQSIQATHKKIASCQVDFGSELSVEKRLKKLPQIALAATMLENGNNFQKNSILGFVLKECSSTQTKLGNELLDFITEVEKCVLKPIGNVLENEIHCINKLRKQLGKLTLDMDSARNRFLAAERHSVQSLSVNVNNIPSKIDKIDTLKEELEDASLKVDQCRDTLATEMFALIAKEPQLSQIYIQLHQLQADYHRSALSILETSLPILENQLSNFPQKPVYGCALEDHLRVTKRQIAQVIETCVYFLLEYGLVEEGLLRIAGSTSKLKKLKSAFDAGLDIDMTDYIRDPHAVSGALKSYLRELPEPLMTFSLYEEWISATKLPDFDSRLQALWQVLHKLPEPNFNNLQFIIKFLSKLSENSEINKMSSQNIAIVMAPNLIYSSEEDASLSLNMSSANLHGTIIDTLISYCDYFFPDADLLFNKLGQLQQQSEDNEIFFNDTKDDSNAYLCVGPNCDTITNSPRTLMKGIKKSAAPSPPAQKQINAEEYEHCSGNNSNLKELCDISTSNSSVDLANLPQVKFKSNSNEISNGKDVIPTPRTSVIRRKSNENISSLSSNKGEKPNIPDKPHSYSTYSLDRKLQKPFIPKISGTEKSSEYVPRTQRPSVPPPERPTKPSRFSTIESNTADSDKLFTEINELSISESKSEITESVQNINSVISFDQQISPKTQASTQSSKQNRFEFLVVQTSEKPPERPPRTTLPVHDLNDKITAYCEKTTNQDHEKLPSRSFSNTTLEPCETLPSTSCLAKSDITKITEKTKPPRPQPPIPLAKPKISENTNL